MTAGAYFGGGTLLKINGHSDQLKDLVDEAGKAGVVIGDYTIPVDENGNVSGGLKVSVRMWAWDSAVPYRGNGWA